MKASLKDLATARPDPVSATPAALPPDRHYRVAQTRANTRQLAAHFPSEVVHAWRVLAAEQDIDSQELMAMAMNMVFERFGKLTRVEVTSGRRKKAAA